MSSSATVSTNLEFDSDIDKTTALLDLGRPTSMALKLDIGGIIICIMIISIIGNLFVITIILAKMGGIRKVINCLVLSLAVADLSQQIFLNFPLAYTSLIGSWDMGSTFCKSHTWIRSSATIASVYTLVVIGIERFRSTSGTTSNQLTLLKTRVILVMIWVYSIAVAWPLYIWSELVGGKYCFMHIKEGNEVELKLFVVFTRVANFLVPLLLTWVCYVGVAYRIRKSSRRIEASSIAQHNTMMQAANRQTSVKVTKACIMMVTMFTVCWAPFQLNMIYLTFGEDKSTSGKAVGYTWIVAAMGTCLNPFIYGLMWNNFRKASKQTFAKLFRGSVWQN